MPTLLPSPLLSPFLSSSSSVISFFYLSPLLCPTVFSSPLYSFLLYSLLDHLFPLSYVFISCLFHPLIFFSSLLSTYIFLFSSSLHCRHFPFLLHPLPLTLPLFSPPHVLIFSFFSTFYFLSLLVKMDCTACHRNPQGSVPTDARLNSLVLLQGALHKHIQAFFLFFTTQIYYITCTHVG